MYVHTLNLIYGTVDTRKERICREAVCIDTYFTLNILDMHTKSGACFLIVCGGKSQSAC